MRRAMWLSAVMVMMWFSVCLAWTPVNGDMIQAAQAYGRSKAKVSLSVFLAPWMSYEEKALRLDDATERAYLYTPFLLIASDAREKAMQKKADDIMDTERILTEYAGFIPFTVRINGDSPAFVQGMKASLQQGKKVIAAAQIQAPHEAVRAPGAKTVYTAQCYLYFPEGGINRNKPVILSIVTSDKSTHRYFFDLAKLR